MCRIACLLFDSKVLYFLHFFSNVIVSKFSHPQEKKLWPVLLTIGIYNGMGVDEFLGILALTPLLPIPGSIFPSPFLSGPLSLLQRIISLTVQTVIKCDFISVFTVVLTSWKFRADVHYRDLCSSSHSIRLWMVSTLSTAKRRAQGLD